MPHKIGVVGKLAYAGAIVVADHTSRCVKEYDSSIEALNDQDVDVIATSIDFITLDFIDEVRAYLLLGRAVGLLVGRSEAEILQVSKTWVSDEIKYSPRVAVIDAVIPQQLESEEWHIVGKDSSIDDAIIAFTSGYRIVSVIAHSDGIDFGLPSGGVCCHSADLESHNDAKNLPSCHVLNHCHRINDSMKNVKSHKKRLSPKDINTSFLLIQCCYFAPTASMGKIKQEHSPFFEINSNNNIKCIVAAENLAFANRQMQDHLIFLLKNGLSIGDSLCSLAKKLPKSFFKANLLLFGDPSFCPYIYDGNISKIFNKNIGNTNKSNFSKKSFKNSSFYNIIIENSIKNYNNILSSSIIFEEDRTSELSKVVLAAPKLWKTWAGSADLKAIGRKFCWVCGNQAREYLFDLSTFSTCRRNITSCDQCGIVEDCPEYTNCDFSLVREQNEVVWKCTANDPKFSILGTGQEELLGKEFSAHVFNVINNNTSFFIPKINGKYTRYVWTIGIGADNYWVRMVSGTGWQRFIA